jgi:protein involved in polysaccharide export with SLBB domain
MSRLTNSLLLLAFSACAAIPALAQDTTNLAVAPRDAIARNTPHQLTGSSNEEARPLPATDIYRIGIGDVLYINILNSSNGKGFYPVRLDGTIDYALAGDSVVVAGRTADEVDRMLSSSIRLYQNPKVEVKIREYGSHRIVLSGLVSNGGVRYIPREAVPLFVVCADAGVNPKAARLLIRGGRSNDVRTYDLRDPETADIVVQAGDELDFLGS